jgi:hypothetical protein
MEKDILMECGVASGARFVYQPVAGINGGIMSWDINPSQAPAI